MTFKTSRKRTYDIALLKLGFTEANGKPKCVVCEKIFSQESMKRNKLLRHLESNHPGCSISAISAQAKVMKVLTTVNKSAVYASYIASYEIAK